MEGRDEKAAAMTPQEDRAPSDEHSGPVVQPETFAEPEPVPMGASLATVPPAEVPAQGTTQGTHVYEAQSQELAEAKGQELARPAEHAEHKKFSWDLSESLGMSSLLGTLGGLKPFAAAILIPIALYLVVGLVVVGAAQVLLTICFWIFALLIANYVLKTDEAKAEGNAGTAEPETASGAGWQKFRKEARATVDEAGFGSIAAVFDRYPRLWLATLPILLHLLIGIAVTGAAAALLAVGFVLLSLTIVNLMIVQASLRGSPRARRDRPTNPRLPAPHGSLPV